MSAQRAKNSQCAKNPQIAKNSGRRTMAVVPVPASDYWLLLDQATAFTEFQETIQVIEANLRESAHAPEAQNEAWGAFFHACKHLLADKAPVFRLMIERAAQARDELAREQSALQRRQAFRIVK
jgi:hypothetical protein